MGQPCFDGVPAALVNPETATPELKGFLAKNGISLILSPTVPSHMAYVLPHGMPSYVFEEETDAGEEQAQARGPEAG